ncbi:MAG: hypothetical protein L0K86_00570 [Actinomycetia bacterium]|nr:hypothetical protein [Actinomycetes bacterium]
MSRPARRSLELLRTDRIDLYLLHWRGAPPCGDGREFRRAGTGRPGQIRYWGISNFDVADLVDLDAVPGGAAVATDQVLHIVARRGLEHDLLPRAGGAAAGDREACPPSGQRRRDRVLWAQLSPHSLRHTAIILREPPSVCRGSRFGQDQQLST